MILQKRFSALFVLSILALAGCRIEGTITYQEKGIQGIEVVLTGPETRTAKTDSSGKFAFTSLSGGQYTVTPTKGAYKYTPESQIVKIGSYTDNKQVHFKAVPNQPPTAKPQAFKTNEDKPIKITLEGSDPDGDALGFKVVSYPDHGMLSGSLPELSYTPDPDFSGEDGFYFIAEDGYLDSEPAEVSIVISPANDAPVAGNDAFAADSVPVLTGDVLANDTDPDNDYLGITNFTQPGYGTIANNENGTFTYSPGTGFTGQDSFTYTVSDPSGAYDTAEVTISVSPQISISADPAAIKPGGTTTLSWELEYADSAAIEPGIGQVASSGSTEATPEEITTYTLKAFGPGGTGSKNVSVEVVRPPQMTLDISPPVITHGESATITWSAFPADRVCINNGIGEVQTSGSRTITPDYTTTYEFTAVNEELTIHNSISVKVLGNPPEPQPEGTLGDQYNDLVPEDASLASYKPERFAVITGVVKDESGNPIPGVKIGIMDHPEYGSAVTNETGRFSIPAEGGGLVVLSYKKEKYLTSHRKINIPVRDITAAEPVTLLARDPAATTVTFNGDPDTMITHQSTETNDQYGGRSTVMVFKGDTRAYELDRYGNRVRELNSITTRATEYDTPQSMPAILPPNSAYTYCTELEADGIERIKFDKPVTVYVDNFLGFEVGEIVPVGYYDRDYAVWVPSDNGMVVQLLDINSDDTIDALDANGDGQADDLNENGDTGDEIAGLDSSSYHPGDTCWRFRVKHFTPWDCNWPYGPPEGAVAPNPPAPPVCDSQRTEKEDCQTRQGSHVNDRSRILHQDISIHGTNFQLHYASNRVKGYKTVINVPASGQDVPASLKRIIVRLKIAGRIIEKTLDPLPNQSAGLLWDGRDFLGRLIKHTTTANIGVGFVYDAVYKRPLPGFGEPGIGWTGNDSRKEITLWKRQRINVFPPQSITKGTSIRGWTVCSHNHLDPLSPCVLQKGDGSLIKGSNLNTINTISAFDAGINCVAADNSGFIYAGTNTCVYRVASDGLKEIIAGTGNRGFSGDGGPAVEAQLDKVTGLELSETGVLYISDTNNHRIRKIDQNGVISTFAGTGEKGFDGDGGYAQTALLNKPQDLEFDQSGNLYIADTGNARIRKINPDGIISTYAGGGDSRSMDLTATEFSIRSLEDLGIDGEGNIYFAGSFNGHCRWVGWDRILKIDTSGIISHFAGSFCSGPKGSGYDATDVPLGVVTALEADPAGNVYVAHYYEYDINYNWGDYDSLIRKINPDGLETIIAGTLTGNASDDSGIGYSGDGGPAVQALLNKSRDLAFDGSANLCIADTNNKAVRTIGPPSTFSRVMADGEVAVADKRGLGYIMDSTGKHQKTIDLETGKTLYTFTYEIFGDKKLLTAITDQFGNQTAINRYSDGTPYNIVSPDGLVTQLSVDANNYLARITLPDGGMYDFDYTSEGLLTEKADPNGNTYQYFYNEHGRITDTYDEHGGHWQFARYVDQDGNVENTVTTQENNVTAYTDQTFSTRKYTSVITGPAGGETFYTRSADGMSVQKDLPCGLSLDFKYDMDTRHKNKYIGEITETTPTGLARTVQKEISYQDTDADEIPDLITRIMTVNGTETYTLENDVPASSKTMISPESRSLNTTYDPQTLLTTSSYTPGLEPTDYYYYGNGRLESIVTGTRQTAFNYDANGYLASITTPENLTTYFYNDHAGRVTHIERPDGTVLEFVYDDNGNVIVLTNPSNVDHEFEYNAVNLETAYFTPLSGSYSYIYDADRRLIQKNFPSGRAVYLDYTNPADPGDKSLLRQIRTPEENISYTYLCSNKIESVSKGPESIVYGYDGKFITCEELSGTMDQRLDYTYNNYFQLASFTYAGKTTTYDYDSDGLLTGAGGVTVSRHNNPGINETGLPYKVSDTDLELERTFNGYGEIKIEDTDVNGHDVYSWNVADRYPDGKIQSLTETLNGAAVSYEYTYDETGRLITVLRGGTLVEEYSYNAPPCGTRTYQMNSLRGITGRTLSYDNEDRLLSTGDAEYQYDADGFLVSKTTAQGTTSYNYGSGGELLSVSLPDGTFIEYVHDPLGRRIAKKVNSTITKKYLWHGRTRLLAVYDGTDNLLMRFSYADTRTPVAVQKQGATYYLGFNHVGSLRAVADSSGDVVKEITYDSFGRIINETNPDFEIPIGFAGGLHDRDTGLVRFGHRDYDPDTGRWTAKDPILFSGGDTDLYGYVLNDPVNLVDPWGLEFSDILPGIKRAVVEGAKGGTYAVGEATKATADIAINGPPLAKTALGVAGLSITAPLAGAAGIAVTPSVVSVYSAAGPYSPIMVDAAYGFFTPGPPPQTPVGYGAWAARRILFGPSWKLSLDTPCK